MTTNDGVMKPSVTKTECRRKIWGALASLMSASGIDDLFGHDILEEEGWSEKDQEKFRDAWEAVQRILWAKSNGSGR